MAFIFSTVKMSDFEIGFHFGRNELNWFLIFELIRIHLGILIHRRIRRRMLRRSNNGIH